MKVAVIGSRSITSYPLEEVIPPETTEIISGGARGRGHPRPGVRPSS